MNKVAQVNLYFWVMKICATTLGETAGDLLSMTLNVGYAISSIILLGLFLVSLTAQLTKSTDKGGLDFGTVGSSLVLATILVVFIVFTTARAKRATPLP